MLLHRVILFVFLLGFGWICQGQTEKINQQCEGLKNLDRLKCVYPISDAMADESMGDGDAKKVSVFDKLSFDYDKTMNDIEAGKLNETQMRAVKDELDKYNIFLPAKLRNLPEHAEVDEAALEAYKTGNMPREDMIEFERLVRAGELDPPEGFVLRRTEKLGIGGKIVDAFTGSDRETTQTKTLPSFRHMPELHQFYPLLLQMLWSSPNEIINAAKSNNPGITTIQDYKGNYFVTSPSTGKKYAVKPGMDFFDFAKISIILAVFADYLFRKGADFRENLFMLPFRLLWDIIVIVGAIWLEVIWVGFLFGSVVGVVIVIIFKPSLFIAPLYLLSFVVNPWPDKEDDNMVSNT